MLNGGIKQSCSHHKQRGVLITIFGPSECQSMPGKKNSLQSLAFGEGRKEIGQNIKNHTPLNQYLTPLGEINYSAMQKKSATSEIPSELLQSEKNAGVDQESRPRLELPTTIASPAKYKTERPDNKLERGVVHFFLVGAFISDFREYRLVY